MTPTYTLQTRGTVRQWWLTADGTLTPDPSRAWAAERWRIDHWRWRLRLPCQITPVPSPQKP